MSALQIIVTAAGREALVNLQNTGTAPVLISEIGLAPQGFVADATMTALPGELKRLVTFAGAVVAEDTIHVTIRDESAEVYSLRGFALYLADGTLFALYGQSDVILEKSSQAMLLLAADVRFVQISATSLSFGDTNWTNPPATTLVAGVIELATPAEANAGSDARRAITPGTLKYTTDQRFGTNAPSPLAKVLLGLDTAELIRERLDLKSAGLKDEGAGNGLDADKLDGQDGGFYRAWDNLTGKPFTFPPTAHSHLLSEIAGAAPLESPSFNGTPTAPTAAQSVNNGQLATTAYVRAAIRSGAYKKVNTQRINTATLAVDADLVIALEPNTAYEVSAFINAQARPTAKFQCQFRTFSALAMQYHAWDLSEGINVWGEAFGNSVVAPPWTDFALGGVVSLWFSGVLVTGASAGTLEFWWAQATASADGTTLQANSYIRATPIG